MLILAGRSNGFCIDVPSHLLSLVGLGSDFAQMSKAICSFWLAPATILHRCPRPFAHFGWSWPRLCIDVQSLLLILAGGSIPVLTIHLPLPYHSLTKSATRYQNHTTPIPKSYQHNHLGANLGHHLGINWGQHLGINLGQQGRTLNSRRINFCRGRAGVG